jgi:hypothetical protein
MRSMPQPEVPPAEARSTIEDLTSGIYRVKALLRFMQHA